MYYCLTNNYTNLCGCYEISIKQMSRDLGYNEETIKNLIKRFEKIHKIIFYNENNKELFIKNWCKYNWTKSEKLDKPLLEEIKKIKTIDFKKNLTDKYNKRDTVSIPYTYAMDTTVSVTVSDTDIDIININGEKKKKNTYPSLDEINDYIKEKQLNIIGKQFYDYFTEGNWIDAKGNKVKNWKQKLLTWNKFAENSVKLNEYQLEKMDNLNNLYDN